MAPTLKTLAIGLLAASSCVEALPFALQNWGFSLSRRAVISHDAVTGFNETVPSGTTGTLMLKYKPWLKVFNGCVPFPAVDAAGNTGGGLETTGDDNSGCSSSTGQVYARAAAYNGTYAIMYSWYMPKDSPSSGLGHRHDWENIVVWLSSQSTSATVRGVAISAHGDYSKETAPSSDGTRVKIGYISYWPVNHQLISTSDKGGEQPVIAWESMTDAARTAIENTDFGSATPSFRDSNFQSYLADAFI
ncbi:necrosis-and ethylene-inducing protein-like protein 1 precursor [Massarina eburnea CBS 473.64]|uniref:Necrosis-and ethylene-inducing protein-like protein 1 n=1 Tax=Massarina eburnea CBS 473.64 TaxID=1395130 RepID=A0A6A6SCI7_9PLEO|nr:necrosis-and ethylene-inducing protein-like protein 1 precursor [Massarina eburnea CBS 473.64]